MKGELTVGPKDGYVEIAALDSEGAEALAYVTVGSPDAGIPWADDAGPFIDAGVPPAVDSGPSADASSAMDGGPTDAAIVVPHDALPGDAVEPASSGGCGCRLAGAGNGSRSLPLGAIGGVVLALGLALRRRRESASRP
jgi:MYXO-CTERM domain-containing protein